MLLLKPQQEKKTGHSKLFSEIIISPSSLENCRLGIKLQSLADKSVSLKWIQKSIIFVILTSKCSKINFRTKCCPGKQQFVKKGVIKVFKLSISSRTAWKTIFSFSGRLEKMVLLKKLLWNMIFLVLSGKVIFLFLKI